MRKFLILFLIIIVTFGIFVDFSIVSADSLQEKVLVEVFVRSDCQHCKAEKEFFLELGLRRDDFTVQFHDIGDKEQYELWKQFTELEHITKVTPITLVGDVVIQGFDAADTTGKRIEELIEKSRGKHSLSFEEFIAAGGSGNIEEINNGACPEDSKICEVVDEPFLVRIPLIGLVNVKKYSLPTLSVMLGFIDGFNPCAMWVLVTFLIILAQIGNRKKMIQIAGLFILAEAILYYLILDFWFNVWDFVGLDRIVTPIVGAVAFGGGLFFLNEWRKSRGESAECKITDLKRRTKTRQKIHKLVDGKFTLLSALGVIALAFSVNVIEFACSIGIPQAFTKILDLNMLTLFSRHLYMSIYIFFYMIDDLIVFAIALYAVEKIGITAKYSNLSHFMGGILMLILGLLLIFRPALLVF